MRLKGNNWTKTCLGILFATVFMLSGFLLWDISARAELIRTGTVVDTDTLNLRSGPGTEYEQIGVLEEGETYTIIEEARAASNNKIWYKLLVDKVEGWVSSSYIQLTETLTKIDKEFDKYLDEQGFPESYKMQLQVLHAKYPNWVFEAQNTGYKWDYVIEQESKLKQNLVSSNSIDSWKSTQDGAYDWETGEWVVFDTGGWVQASVEMVQHYMDPRNFLDSTNVFQFLKQSYDASSMTKAELKAKKADLVRMVEGTYLEGTYKEDKKEVAYVDTIMDAAKETGVCPLTLASMMIQEQGRDGKGKCISGTVSGYKGYYNYFNIGAYATSSMTSIQRGLWYAKGSGKGSTTYGRPWDTRTASIHGGASYYGTNYVNVGQDTMYLKKFNVQGDNPFTHEYMTNVQGAASEGQHMAAGYDENARESALVFKIPVYEKMPKNPCERPTGDKNPNYMLKSLKVSGYSLTPTFSYDEKKYSVIVPNNVISVKISAKAVADTTTIKGTGEVTLEVGTNTFKVKAKAENGDSRTYTLTIVRQEGNGSVSLTTTKYKINEDSTITGISGAPIKVSDFEEEFSIIDGSFKVTDSNGSKEKEKIGTGNQVRVYDAIGKCVYTYDVIIYGDTNGDGVINPLDLLRVQKHILGISKLKGVYKSAGDTNKDGKINALDLLQVQKQILGIKSIKQ